MIRALFRKGAADLRYRPLQIGLLFIVIASASAILMLSLSMETSVKSSFERAHDQANGAHVWLSSVSAGVARQTASYPGVLEATDVYEQVRGSLMTSANPDDVVFMGIGEDVGGIAPGVIDEGRWLKENELKEAVITRGLARHSGVKIGDVIEATTVNTSAPLRIVGTLIDTSNFPYPQSSPGVVFVSKSTATELAGGPLNGLTPEDFGNRRADFTIGLRIEDPEAVDQFVSDVRYGRESILYYAKTWTEIREKVAVINESPVIILRIFSFFGLIAAGIIVASALTGHVMAQMRDVGVLKATGFSPRHVMLLFWGQHVVLGLVAALVGVGLAVLSTPLILDIFGELLYSGTSPVVELDKTVIVVVGIGVLVFVFTLLPSWRAGRTSTVEALSRRSQWGASKPSRLGRYAIRMNMPHVVTFGIKDVFSRRARAWLTVASVTVVAAVVMMTLMLFGMLDRLENDPAAMGAWPYELRVERLGEFGTPDAANGAFVGGVDQPVTHAELVGLVDSYDEAQSRITVWETSTLVEEVGDRLQTFIIYGPVEEFGFRITEGRMFTNPHEAVIGLGFAQTYGLGVGDQVTVVLRLNEDELIRIPLSVVGVYVFSENLGRVVMYSAETLVDLGVIDESTAPIGSLAIKLGQGVDVGEFADTLVAETGGRVAVSNMTQIYKENLEDELALKPLLLSLNSILIAVAAINMFVALLFAVRERTREFGIMKTVGFTPRQIITTVILGAAVLAAIGVVIGTPVGYYLTRFWMLELADTDGLPTDLVRLPSAPWLTVMVLLGAVLAAVGSALPARRAADISVSEALKLE